MGDVEHRAHPSGTRIPNSARYLRTMRTIRACSIAGICACFWMGQTTAQLDTTAASESAWWKGLFRSKTLEQVDTLSRAIHPVAADSMVAPIATLDTSGHMEIPHATKPERTAYLATEWRVEADSRLSSMDSVWRANPPAMQGYRIQIMTGSLHACRMERSRLRGQTNWEVYVVPMSLNYQVLIGDFRDAWSAEAERKNWSQSHPSAMVVPGEIALPPLQVAAKEIAEPLPGPGDQN